MPTSEIEPENKKKKTLRYAIGDSDETAELFRSYRCNKYTLNTIIHKSFFLNCRFFAGDRITA